MKEFGYSLWTSTTYWEILILLVIICVLLKVCYPKIIGWFGEHWTKQQLKKLPANKYTTLNNIMIRTSRGTCQIDHIVVSVFGIFVIETKQYNGYFTGDKYDKKWVMHSRTGKTYLYENPIRQNYGHVKSICELLNLDETKAFNIVCIPSANVRLKIKHDGELTTIKNIVERITSFDKPVIDNPKEIVKTIIANNIVDIKGRKKHIKEVKKNKPRTNNMCPKCGGTLVKREGQYGSFLGCSNYPKCKYTRNK